jgi:hypothetical protein
VAKEIEKMKAFGPDTTGSFAAYIRNMKTWASQSNIYGLEASNMCINYNFVINAKRCGHRKVEYKWVQQDGFALAVGQNE